ncbi:hypothetical protein TeGR_g11279 [Tetraparma gracilis]|uniref:Uncharacterized protein n=1 Tax=Tetraparma gracilis TaxID=2962635 RepID=A0ABQ6N7J6_9STRA|nr:hypothetical protein TeGR_g11279 [Tetraparma gracilis]
MPSIAPPKATKPLSKSASLPAVGGATPAAPPVPKMRKMSTEDQACFMIISEHVHPQLRLSYPATNKLLAGITAYIVNTLMAAPSIQEGLLSMFGECEMLGHALANVGSVVEATEYPGNLYLIVPYVPVEDKVVAWQIVCVVEYVMTELLALAGGFVEKARDQEEFKTEKRESYEDFPKIRPSDLKAAVTADPELRACIGSLFKV